MSESALEGLVERAASLLAKAKRVVVFTGAGISTESGIPDFRSPGGIWENYTPVYYSDFIASEEARKEYWRFHSQIYASIADAKPNAAHLAIAELDAMGILDCVITQNIDFLHQRAGLPEEKVIELHGTVKWVDCLQCGARSDRRDIQKRLDAGEEVPRCKACGGILKPATVSFGQAMPERETAEAISRARRCDLCLTAGSSLVVYPAAQVPEYAFQGGAKLIIVNMAKTHLDSYADVVIHEKVGVVLSDMVRRAKDKRG